MVMHGLEAVDYMRTHATPLPSACSSSRPRTHARTHARALSPLPRVIFPLPSAPFSSSLVPLTYISRTPRRLPMIGFRYARNKTSNLQHAWFNGDGYESWENVWGMWNMIVRCSALCLVCVLCLVGVLCVIGVLCFFLHGTLPSAVAVPLNDAPLSFCLSLTPYPLCM